MRTCESFSPKPRQVLQGLPTCTVIYQKSTTWNGGCGSCSQFMRALLQTLSAFQWLYPLLALSSVFLLVPAAKASLDPTKAITQFVHQAWQSEQGLQENSVAAIAQTKDGYLWLGTEGGLAHFDGIPFTIFEKHTAPGLGNNFITSLLLDLKGVL